MNLYLRIIGAMLLLGKNRNMRLGRKPVHLPLCPRRLAWDRTRSRQH